MLHLNQNVQLFLKYLRGRTKASTNKINALKCINLSDATLQACQEIINPPLLTFTSVWSLQLARASILYLDQQAQPSPKWIL